VIIEKPFGKDLASAQELNRVVHPRIFRRADVPNRPFSRQGKRHKNILVLRFCQFHFRADLEPAIYRAFADHRCRDAGGWKDAPATTKAQGALRDMVQNHLLQLLCLVAMEAPTDPERRQHSR